jgi:hypothetical protein
MRRQAREKEKELDLDLDETSELLPLGEHQVKLTLGDTKSEVIINIVCSFGLAPIVFWIVNQHIKWKTKAKQVKLSKSD